jgi:hypothetical protein
VSEDAGDVILQAGKAGLINRLGCLVEVPRDTLAVFVEAADDWQFVARKPKPCAESA